MTVTQVLLLTFAWGLLGACVGQIVEFFTRLRSGTEFNVVRATVVVAIAGFWTATYFTFLESARSEILFAHYGLFVVFAIEELTRGRGPQHQPEPVVAAAVPPTVLVLNGYGPVYGVGAFGAFLVELHTLYAERKRRLDLPMTYWVVSSAMVLSGGVVTILYGVSNVNALLALQIGASTSLVAKRLRR